MVKLKIKEKNGQLPKIINYIRKELGEIEFFSKKETPHFDTSDAIVTISEKSELLKININKEVVSVF